MSLPNNRVVAAYIAPSVVIVASIIRATMRWAALAELPWLWWLPSLRLMRDMSDLGWVMFVAALIALAYGVKQRSHPTVASTSLATATIVYLFMLEVWLNRPGDHVDPRLVFTMIYALVPLYVAIFALAAHATILLRARNS